MDDFIDLILSGQVRPPLLNASVLELDDQVPRSDLLALLVLERKGSASMSDLATALGAPLSTLTGIGQRLEEHGLVRREQNPADRRVSLVHLTPRGQALAEQVRKRLTALVAHIRQQLTSEELEQFVNLLARVSRAMDTFTPEDET